MPVSIEYDETVLIAGLSGEIDHHSARALREEIDDALSRCLPERLVLDFSAVSFMDSSGIGLVMGRYKLASLLGARLALRGGSPQIKKVLRLAGLDRLTGIEMEGKL